MTIEEWENWVFDHGASGKAIRHAISEFASAALRERDAEWAKALLPVGACVECDEAFGAYLESAICQDHGCARLRALLEEAGK